MSFITQGRHGWKLCHFSVQYYGSYECRGWKWQELGEVAGADNWRVHDFESWVSTFSAFHITCNSTSTVKGFPLLRSIKAKYYVVGLNRPAAQLCLWRGGGKHVLYCIFWLLEFSTFTHTIFITKIAPGRWGHYSIRPMPPICLRYCTALFI